MRTTMGKRIDGLSNVERDRLITARDFNSGYTWWFDGCGCLEGTIVHGMPSIDIQSACEAAQRRHGTFNVPWWGAPPSIRYPKAVGRFGKDRVVRAIKLRAAKNHRPLLPTPTQHVEHAEV